MARGIFTLTVGAVDHRNRLRFHLGEETELKYQVGTFGVPVSQIPITESGNVKTGNFLKWIGMRTIVEEKQEAAAAAAAVAAYQRQRQAQIQIQRQPYSQTQQTHWQMQIQAQMQVQAQPMEYIISNNNASININNNNNFPSSTSFVEYPGLNDVVFRKGISLMHHPGNDYFHGLIQSKIFEHGNASQTGKSRIAWWVVDEIRKRKGRFLTWHQQGWWALLEDESKIRLRVAVFFREWKKQFKAKQNHQKISDSNSNTYKFRGLQNGEK